MNDPESWAKHAEEWLDRDLALMTDDAGWQPVVSRPGLAIWSRAMPDDDNRLFRWRLAALEAPAEAVFEGFVHRLLEHHKEWTPEFVGGHVVQARDAGARILYQRFDPGVPGIAQRDLCSADVVRVLGPGRLLASFRSVDALPPAPRHERIDWWGAALCRTLEDGERSELTYLDRENQGGYFPSWLMNRMMPRYLILQAEAVQRFFGGDDR